MMSGDALRYTILSTCELLKTPALGCVSEFENVLCNLLGARLLSLGESAGGLFGRSAIHARDEPSEDTLPADRVLVLVALKTSDLRFIDAVPDWRRRYGTVIAYVFDCFAMAYPRIMRKMDAVFVPAAYYAKTLAVSSRARTIALPLGVDALGLGGVDPSPVIDIVAYGRQPLDLLRRMDAHINRQDSPRLMYHTPYESLLVRSHAEQRRMFWRLLRKTQASLCYSARQTGDDRWAEPILSQRYYESWAAGCVVVGELPDTDEARTLADWQDAVIPLPLDCADPGRAIEGWLDRAGELSEIRHRNYLNALRQHDWRHRVAAMLENAQLPRPAAVCDALRLISSRLGELSPQSKVGEACS